MWYLSLFSWDDRLENEVSTYMVSLLPRSYTSLKLSLCKSCFPERQQIEYTSSGLQRARGSLLLDYSLVTRRKLKLKWPWLGIWSIWRSKRCWLCRVCAVRRPETTFSVSAWWGLMADSNLDLFFTNIQLRLQWVTESPGIFIGQFLPIYKFQPLLTLRLGANYPIWYIDYPYLEFVPPTWSQVIRSDRVSIIFGHSAGLRCTQNRTRGRDATNLRRYSISKTERRVKFVRGDLSSILMVRPMFLQGILQSSISGCLETKDIQTPMFFLAFIATQVDTMGHEAGPQVFGTHREI